jgi:hypothetical protein
MKHDKTATLRNMIIRDYSRYRDDLLDIDKSLFDRFVVLEREDNVFDYEDLLWLLDEFRRIFSVKISGNKLQIENSQISIAKFVNSFDNLIFNRV